MVLLALLALLVVLLLAAVPVGYGTIYYEG